MKTDRTALIVMVIALGIPTALILLCALTPLGDWAVNP